VRARATIVGVTGAAVILAGSWQLGVLAETALTSTGPTSAGPSTSATAGAPAAASGTFVGTVQSTRYGNVQVQVVVASGQITDVVALHLTDDGGRSVQISNQAAPILRSEVLAAQSAKVSNVSGATYTTKAYLLSVQSALDQAGI
jgi:uncharacterized protein with FMN-binding domain